MDQNPSTWVSKWKPSQIIQATLWIVLIGLGFWTLVRFRNVIFILFSAIVVSTAILPLVDWLARRGVPRAMSVILIYLILLGLVAGFLVSFAPLVVNQAAEMTATLDSTYQEAQLWMLSSPSTLLRRLAIELPPKPPVILPEGQLPTDPAAQPLPPQSGTGEQAPEEKALAQVATLFNYVSLAARIIFVTVALLLLIFYWTLDGQRTVRSILMLIPVEQREDIREVIVEIQERVGGYIRGLFILSMTVGAMALVAYLIIDLPYALLLALIAGVMEAIPVIGPALGAIPAILVASSQGQSDKILWIILASGLIQALENTVLVPRIMGRSVGVHPLVTLLSLITFSSLLGIPGALLAIPIAAILQIVIDRTILRPGSLLDTPAPAGRDAVSALRLELQELRTDVRMHMRSKEDDGIHPESDELEDAIDRFAEELEALLPEFEPPEEPQPRKAARGKK